MAHPFTRSPLVAGIVCATVVHYIKNQKIHKMDIEIRLLTKDLKDDYLFFFDNIIFQENPDRSKCYCYDYHFLGEVATCTREMSRSAVINLINENKLTGYLVFDNDIPIGWCNANNRLNYQRLLRDFDLIDNPDDKVCSIVCFLIHPDYRRQGIAQNILEKIIKDYSNKDFDYIEAYPRKGELSSEGNFKGPLELYKRFDFKINKEYDDYYVMRRSIK
jgi:ribosomal protein S18 acetylase RimI-like enzyme